MKHTLLVVCCAIVLLVAPGAVPARAAEPPALSAAQAEAIARSMLPVPAADVKSVNLEAGHWFLAWETPAGRTTVEMGSATGQLYSFARQPVAAKPFRYTVEEARMAAAQWLAKLAPDLQEQLRPTGLVPLLYGDFAFTWERVEQGYPVRGDGVLIRIDGHTGALSGFTRMAGPHGSFVAPATPPDPEAALKIYREEVGLVLIYRQGLRPDRPLDWGLVYTPAYTFPYVDLTGNLLSEAGWPAAQEPTTSGQLVPPVAELPPKPAAPLSEAEAIAVAQGALHTDQKPDVAQYQEWAGGHGGFYELAWASGGYAAVDADTGLLVNFSSGAPGGCVPQVTVAEARTAAIEFIRRWRPDLAGRLVVTSPDDDYGTRFQVLKDGVPLENRSVEIYIGLDSGQVAGFRVMPLEAPGDRFQFEETAGILTEQAAMSAFLQQSPLELTWLSFERESGWQTKLVWAPRAVLPGAIAAHSGTVLAQGGTPITAPGAPADLAGHPTRRAVELLTLSGIIDGGQPFRPDAPAALADLKGWLQAATGRDTLPKGLTADVDWQAPLSRQTFALWAVQAAGYGPVAAMQARIELPFADSAAIKPEYANAAGLLAGLGIIPADRFEPDRAVTRGEAARIIQGIITHLQGDAAQ